MFWSFVGRLLEAVAFAERSWLRSGIRFGSGGYVVGDVDDVAVISLEPVVRSPRFYAQFVELVNAIKTRPLLTQICPLIVSPKSHHHHRRSGRYLDVSGRISAPFRSTLESFLKLSRRPFDPVSTTSQSVRSFPRYSHFPSTSPPLPPLAYPSTFGLSGLEVWDFPLHL